ncbi:aminotransferase class III-fold pyridoxal phosphate-dependent enzyme [Variovorax dokdonensis]|uniref:Aminotransferase class III-fold pyridoxal phosphate-dependent enzyme n=1 Tax=Variovorax dokdonensis TaxID=344883 RepID=A0ABT7NCG2_9BURK|nr:aminotransferase class III-fold pyridoxal phosphate-dependent enzyme [Variovorax dokdonensis]MDM0045634.1 aminotransferase class III-fold pyridoxal phosphate-dependent enzyme [Variovorax dokdonensis]
MPLSAKTFDVRTGNAQHMFHPMIDPKVVRQVPPLIIERGDGVHVFDIDGKRYLDTVASLWNVNVGHNRPEITEAITAQLGKIAYYSTFQNTSNPPAIELSQRLAAMFAPEKMTKVLFSSGGSDAVETALKIARQYWKLEGQSERVKFISLKQGYHGVHFGGASINGNPAFRTAYEPLMPGCFQIESPDLYRNPWGETDPERLAARCADELERTIQYQGAHTIAAFIAEPVQGAGGVIVPPATYWPLMRKVLDKHGVLLISDEIVTGFGRIGAMCGARAWGVAPDIMAMAKGINSGYVPLGATLFNERVAQAFDKPDVPAALMHGYTYSGHALACAAANANLAIVEAEDLPARALDVGGYLLDRLEELRRYAQVGDVRGKGLMVAVELVRDRTTKAPLTPPHAFIGALVKGAREEGAIIRVQGNRLILSPPLVFSHADVDETLRILHAAFSAAQSFD